MYSLSPGVHLFRVSLCISLLGVLWPTSSPVPWGVPCDGLTVDGFWRFPECVSYPHDLCTVMLYSKYHFMEVVFLVSKCYVSAQVDLMSLHGVTFFPTNSSPEIHFKVS